MKTIPEFQGKYRFLSNFWPCNVELDGIVYPSSEHAYVAYKTKDIEKRKEIALTETPGQVKRLGRSIVLRHDWDQVKLNVMHRIVTAKFTQNPDLKELLLNTGDAFLQEGNTWGDMFWGVCRGKGENNLGHILMRVRREIA